jgi:NADH-quinone oxidoreductase subunit G
VQAKKALENAKLVQVGAIRGEISRGAEVMLPAAAYSEIEGSFINMEGRVRVAENPLRSLGEERPLWKVMMRLTQALGCEVPAVNIEELRAHVSRFLPDLARAWETDEVDGFMMPVRRNPKAEILPAKRAAKAKGELDVVGRYSMYREGMWARASDLLSHAGRLHALDDVLVHPDTLKKAGLAPGEQKIVTADGELCVNIGTRTDVVPGVLYVAKRGVAGDLSSETSVALLGGGE